MENYVIVEDTTEDCQCPLPKSITEGVMRFELKKNSKFGNILKRVEREFEENGVRKILFYGVGDACAKCVACVEVLKNNYGSKQKLYQWNTCTASISRDTWAPTEGADHRLDRLVVEKRIPTIFVLISRDPFPEETRCRSQQVSDEQVSFVMPSTDQPQPSTSSQQKHRRYTQPYGSGRERTGRGGDGSSYRRSEGDQTDHQKPKPVAPNKWRRPPKGEGETSTSNQKKNDNEKGKTSKIKEKVSPQSIDQ